jgi:NADH:ubiquinone oxidoreductase subunit F (NADH-binding)
MVELLEAAGGAVEPLQALLVGGYFGTWVDTDRALSARLARQDLRAIGATLGSGVLIALGESSCGLHETARVTEYLAAASARQCGPCVHGLAAVSEAVNAIADGTASFDDRERVLRWCSEIRGRGACHHPDGAVRFVESAFEIFAHEIERHRHGRCHGRAARLPIGPRLAGARR